MDLLMFATVTMVALMAVLMVLFLLLRARNDMRTLKKQHRPSRRKRKEDMCGICFGAVSKGDIIARCGCGNVFHDSCAGPVGACPYCGSSHTDLVREMPDCVTCPSCGSDVTGNVCGCGAVVNRDGTFTCGCGTLLDVNGPVCKRCGKEYDVCSGRGRT
jgi:hypothetical protein